MYERLVLLPFIFTSCLPVFNGDRDIGVSFEYLESYSVLHIDSVDAIYSVKMQIKGQDLRFNDTNCTVLNSSIVCTVQKMKNYTLPFKGIVTNISLNYMDKDGKAKYYSYP